MMTFVPQNGTLECMAGSHRSQLSKHAQVNTVFSGAGREAQWPISLNPPNGPPEQDKGEDPSIYSDNHIVHKAPAGTIVAFQNGMWHRALPNLTDKPRTGAFCIQMKPLFKSETMILPLKMKILPLKNDGFPCSRLLPILPLHDAPAAP